MHSYKYKLIHIYYNIDTMNTILKFKELDKLLYDKLPKDLVNMVYEYYNNGCDICRLEMTLCHFCDDYFCEIYLYHKEKKLCMTCNNYLYKDEMMGICYCSKHYLCCLCFLCLNESSKRDDILTIMI